MVSRVFSAGLSGIDGYIVTVECFLSGGLPRLDVVGLPTGAVSKPESASVPPQRPVPLTGPCPDSPATSHLADTKRQEQHTICLSAFHSGGAGEIDAPPQRSFFGELSLTGELRPVCGALSMALALRVMPVSKPYSFRRPNAAEGILCASSVTVFPIRT